MTGKNVLGGGAELLAEVARLSGLSPLLGPGVIRRALADAGATVPERARPADFLRALPALEARMLSYVPPEEAAERVARIVKLLNSHS